MAQTSHILIKRLIILLIGLVIGLYMGHRFGSLQVQAEFAQEELDRITEEYSKPIDYEKIRKRRNRARGPQNSISGTD